MRPPVSRHYCCCRKISLTGTSKRQLWLSSFNYACRLAVNGCCRGEVSFTFFRHAWGAFHIHNTRLTLHLAYFLWNPLFYLGCAKSKLSTPPFRSTVVNGFVVQQSCRLLLFPVKSREPEIAVLALFNSFCCQIRNSPNSRRHCWPWVGLSTGSRHIKPII